MCYMFHVFHVPFYQVTTYLETKYVTSTLTLHMVLYILSIKAELDGVERIALDPLANLCFDIRNPNSDYETREKVVVDPKEYVPQDEDNNSREPPCHFQITWEGSKKKSVLTILKEEEMKTALKKSKPQKKQHSSIHMIRNVTAEDSDQYVPILAMETRGIEPYAFHCMGGEFIVTSTGGTVFSGDDVDLSQEFADYDETHDVSVSITDVSFKIDAI